MIAADVDFDITLILDGPAPDVTVPKAREHLCYSATGHSSAEADWECVVYESEWMTLQLFRGEVKIAPSLAPPPNPSQIVGAKWSVLLPRAEWPSWDGRYRAGCHD
jgi:hypothetical protein